MIIINFKTYPESTGKNAIKLARTIKEVSDNSGVEIIACPQQVDLRSVVDILPRSTWAQSVDGMERGRATGWFPVEIAKEIGATGTLLNHSEHKLTSGQLGEAINRAKHLDLTTTVLADSVAEARAASLLYPDFVGYEPPELIASKETSVAKAKPSVIKDVVEGIPNTKVVVGAGVKDSEDVRVSLKLGAVGVVLASAVVKSDDPKKILLELAQAFSK